MTQSAQPPSPESLLEHREWLRAIARSLVADESAVDDVEQRTSVHADFVPSVSVAPGDYTVRLRLPGEVPQDQRCTVKPGETASVRFSAR